MLRKDHKQAYHVDLDYVLHYRCNKPQQREGQVTIANDHRDCWQCGA